MPAARSQLSTPVNQNGLPYDCEQGGSEDAPMSGNESVAADQLDRAASTTDEEGRTSGMSFHFRYAQRAHAGPTQKEVAGMRQISLHASNVVEAADRFLRA